jgi:AcrR family transcriptional regulator
MEKDTRRIRIKEVALTLFASKGYHETSTSSIIQKAGVSKGLLFFHFPSKEDLLKELMFEWMTKVWDEVTPELSSDLDPILTLEKFMESIIDSLEKYQNQYRLYYSLLLTAHPFTSREALRNIPSYQKLQNYLHWQFGKLAPGNLEAEIRFFSSIMLGAEMNYLLVSENQLAEYETIKKRVIAIYKNPNR